MIKAELEGEAALKSMRERERRTYLRRLQEDEDASDDDDDAEGDEGEGEGEGEGEVGEDDGAGGGVLPVASLTLDNLQRHDAGDAEPHYLSPAQRQTIVAGVKTVKQNDWEADLSDEEEDDDDNSESGRPNPA